MQLKRVVLLIASGFILACCQEVSYPEVQPAGIPALKEVPSTLQGRYSIPEKKDQHKDTLTVKSWGYHFRDQKEHDWLGKGVLSDTLVLKDYQGYYFVNFKSGSQWVLRVIKQKPNGSIEFKSINIGEESKKKSAIKKLSKKFPVKETKERGDTYYQIAPTKEQLMQLIKEGYFTGDTLEKIN